MPPEKIEQFTEDEMIEMTEEKLPVPPDTEDVFDEDEEDEDSLGEKGKSALKKLRNEVKRLKKDNSRYKEIDLEEYQKIQEEKKKTEEQRLRDQQQWETLSRKHERTIKSQQEDISGLQSKIQQLTKETELKDYYYASEGLQGRSKVDGRSYFDHVKDAIAKRTRREADGSYTVLDIEGYDQKNSVGKPMSIAELLEELREDSFYGHYFKPRARSGGGMSPNTRSPFSGEDNSPEARWERIKKKTGYRGVK